MWRNYLRTFLRQILKFRSTHALNILGLSFGLACCLVCFLHIRYEFSFDKFHSNEPYLYRLVTGDPASSDSWVRMAPPISPKLKAEIPEIEGYVRLSGVSWNKKVMVEHNAQLFLEPHFLMADKDFFQFFDYPLVQGDKATVLANPDYVMISEAAAVKLFGEENPIGKIIRLKDNQLDFQVSGVFKNFPANTHMKCDYLVSFENLDRIFGKGSTDAWRQYNYFAYLKLHPGADKKVVESKIRAITFQLPNQQEVSFNDFELQPITAIHFEHNRGNFLPAYDVRYIYIFATLAFSVFIICLMNYFNMTAMLSMKRIKEIGVRKSIGASNIQLNVQFILESILFAFISVILALGIVEVLKPALRTWLDSPVEIQYSDPLFILFMIGFCMLLALVSAAYLTVYVNRFKASSILKGTISKGGRGVFFQHSLIVVQFGLSIVLLVSSLVIVNQMHYLHNKDLGFDKEQVISVPLSKDISVSTRSALKQELSRSPLVQDVAYSDFVPGEVNWNQPVWWEGQVEAETMFIIAVGQDFIPAMKMELLEGTVEEMQSASEIQYFLNEAALKQIGWTSGKGKLLSPFGEAGKKPVLGVVKNFNYKSLHSEVAPLVVLVYPELKFSQLTVRLNAGKIQEGINETGRIFKAVTGGVPFEFSFLDDNINALYASETRMQRVIVVLTAVSVCFALLGIYTLISFAIENRSKEIAIRKVLGVSAQSLITLFTASYFRLVVLASVLAVPVSWKLMNSWLSHFNDHVELNAGFFIAVIAGLIGLVACIGLSKYVSIKEVNPVQSLKND